MDILKGWSRRIKQTKSSLVLILIPATIILISFTYSNKEVNGTLFSVVDPSRSNIHFNNKIKDTKDHNIMIYSNYYGGAGVGLGDINNDGLADLFFAGNLETDKLYLNKGDMVFENITTSAGILDDGGWSSGVIMADINQDGFLDIYVTRELYDDNVAIRKNKLYINNQDNTFTAKEDEYGVGSTERTRHASFLDYDKDGDLDLFLLNQPPNPGDYSKFYGTELLLPEYAPKLLQNQNGKFIDVSVDAGFDKTGFPNSLTASDLNGDGWVDLYIANDFWVPDWYYINNGDGTFTDKILEDTKHISYFSMGVDAADINNDGALDVSIVDMVAEDNYRQKANMSGMNPKAFWKVVNDGGHHQYMFNTLQLNQGDGKFSDIAQLGGLANTDWSWSVLMADLDNDGWKDIHITNGLMRDIRNKDATKKIAKKIETAAFEQIQKDPTVEIGSIWDIIDIDETLDLVPSQKLKNYTFRNKGDLSFEAVREDWGMDQSTFSNGAAYGDLDNDGDIDLVLNNINDPALIYENHSDQKEDSNYLRVKPITKENGGHVFGCKLWVKSKAGIQFTEITGVRGMYSTSETIAHFGLGEEKTVSELKIRWPDGNEQTLKNIPANQLLEVEYETSDISIKKSSSTTKLFTNITDKDKLAYKHIENRFDDYKTQVLMPHKMSTSGPVISSADVNGDGLEDIFVGGAIKQTGNLFLQSADGTFNNSMQAAFIGDGRKEDVGSVFFDADGDGDQDLYVVSGGNEYREGADNYQDRLYINNGHGIFSKDTLALPDMKFCGSKVSCTDIDKDGDLDLLVAGHHVTWSYPEPVSSVLLINENGVFKDRTDELAPMLKNIGMVNDLSWFDHDNDGWDDLVIVGEWMPLTILRNNKGVLEQTNADQNELTTGWWFSLETADMDGDGDEDIIAGNLGLNYKYKATEEEPFGVYYYDFDGNDSKDVVLTYYNFGIEYPVRGKQCSSEQVPTLNETFETYDLFASSDIAGVYGENDLQSALHYDAYTFASTYFENNGDGTFTSHLLPNIAQTTSINDILINDYNDDSHLDILVAGNLYNAEVETSRADGGYGLLLLGDGNGNFEPMSKMDSGIDIPFNVKSLLEVKTDTKRLVLAGCNNDQLQVLKLN